MKTRGFEIISRYRDAGIALPVRRTASSAGYDIAAAEDAAIAPGASALLATGLKAYMLPDEALFLHIRSSLAAKRGLCLTNSVGVIDADYYDNAENEGHILVALTNRSGKTVQVRRGERIAQAVFQKYLVADGDVAGAGASRTGGFGSTGR